MLKLPRFKKGRPLNQYKSLRIGAPEGVDCVSPKDAMKKAIVEAFEEVLAGSKHDIKITDNDFHIDIGGD